MPKNLDDWESALKVAHAWKADNIKKLATDGRHFTSLIFGVCLKSSPLAISDCDALTSHHQLVLYGQYSLDLSWAFPAFYELIVSKKPLSINIPLHGPRVEIILAWLGAVHLPELEL